MNPYYTDYGEYLNRLFPGEKVQKLSVNGGMSCPNRDGTISRGGCIYCDNSSFSPEYTAGRKSVTEQLRAGKEFFARKYPHMRYLAYFQSFTNTHGDVNYLRGIFNEALADDDVKGLIIGTRPDCLGEPVLNLLEELKSKTRVIVELGAESAHNRTLEIINRGHRIEDTVAAVDALYKRGINTGVHLIAGLPFETEEDVLSTVDLFCSLPIDTIKMHQMQIIRGTELHRRHVAGESGVMPWELDDYLNLCVEIVARVPRRIAIERFVSQAPPGMLVAPCWGLKNYQFTNLLHNKLKNKFKGA